MTTTTTRQPLRFKQEPIVEDIPYSSRGDETPFVATVKVRWWRSCFLTEPVVLSSIPFVILAFLRPPCVFRFQSTSFHLYLDVSQSFAIRSHSASRRSECDDESPSECCIRLFEVFATKARINRIESFGWNGRSGACIVAIESKGYG